MEHFSLKQEVYMYAMIGREYEALHNTFSHSVDVQMIWSCGTVYKHLGPTQALVLPW